MIVSKKESMSRKLYVGNLPFQISREEVEDAFQAFGTVTDVHLVTDRETGRPRGFGFVEYSSPEEAQAAAEALDGSQLAGRTLRVDVARPREGGGGGGGGGFRGGGGGGRGGGGGGYRGGGGGGGGGYRGGGGGGGGYGGGGGRGGGGGGRQRRDDW